MNQKPMGKLQAAPAEIKTRFEKSVSKKHDIFVDVDRSSSLVLFKYSVPYYIGLSPSFNVIILEKPTVKP